MYDQNSIEDIPSTKLPSQSKTSPREDEDCTHTVAIGLGSNLSDSFCNIEQALRLLEDFQKFHDGQISNSFIHVVDTSFLYETAPMYLEDQPRFINGACIIETNLSPVLLLQVLKQIEAKLDRRVSVRYGPRTVDLDILFFDDYIIDSRKNTQDFEAALIIPHPHIQEREFVLRPLNDMIPDFVHPVLQKTVESLFQEVIHSGHPMMKVMPFPHVVPSSDGPYGTQCSWTLSKSDGGHCRSRIMAIVNTTPDSFSDGGEYMTVPAAVSCVSSAIFAGASIVDIGGCATSPKLLLCVSVEEEINRVIPVIRAIRDRKYLESFKHDIGTTSEAELQTHIETILTTPISIDTFRWQVAEAAIQAGANCINDVHAFGGPTFPWDPQYTEKMKAVARKHAVPIVLAHSRGSAETSQNYSTFDYAADERGRGAVTEGVRVELGSQVDLITKGKGGVRRWLVFVDPGIGFSKSTDDNCRLLARLQDLTDSVMIGHGRQYRNPIRNFPVLLGSSKKSFLGKLLSRPPAPRQTHPKDRLFATAATMYFAVKEKASVIRVHDVEEMMDVLNLTDKLWN